MIANADPIIVEQTFDKSIEEVWTAISDLSQMHEWYFKEITSFEPEVGFETRFDVKVEGRNFGHIWRIKEVKAPSLISYDWSYGEYPGKSVAVFELSAYPEGTKLKLTHTVLEPFPQEIPEFKRESGLAGWNYIIKTSLKEFLARN